MPHPIGPRFWAKVYKTNYCWLWQGAQNTLGYGVFAVNGVAQLTHRLAYEDAHGAIPDDMTIDHRCRTRNCVNPGPMHMEVVTITENNRRKKSLRALAPGDECINGHHLAAGDIYRHPRGHTECRHCRRELNAARRALAKTA